MPLYHIRGNDGEDFEAAVWEDNSSVGDAKSQEVWKSVKGR